MMLPILGLYELAKELFGELERNWTEEDQIESLWEDGENIFSRSVFEWMFDKELLVSV